MTIQFLRGNTSQNDALTRPAGAFSIDLEGENLRIHDGATAGGAFQIGVSTEGTTNLSVNYTTTSFTVTSSTGTDATVAAATATEAGAMTSADRTKLDGIESGAEANYEIATTVQAEAGTDNTVVMTPLRVVELIEAQNYTIDEGTL